MNHWYASLSIGLLFSVLLLAQTATAQQASNSSSASSVADASNAKSQSGQWGYAAVSVDSTDIAPIAFSVNRALQGKIAGAYVTQNSGNPAGGMSVRLRGPSTILGDTSPLYVLDGIPISNASRELIDLGGGSQNRLIDLALHDIERIDIVRGATGAAQYGPRANNGVVEIFTKQGTSGAPRVTFSTRAQTESVRNTLNVNMAQNAQGQFLDNDGNPLPEGERRWDWQDFIFDRAYGTEQALSISGGFGDTRYRASGSHFANQGIIEGNHFRRINGRLRIDQQLTDWAALTGSATYARSTTQDIPNGGLNRAYGALTGFIAGPNTFDPRPNVDGSFPDDGFRLNPLEVMERFDFTQDTDRFIGSAALNLRPTENLSVDYVIGLDTYTQDATAIVPSGFLRFPNAPADARPRSARSSTYTQQRISSTLDVSYSTDLSSTLRSTTLIGGSVQLETSTTDTEEIQGRPEDPFSQGFSTFDTDYDVYSGFVQETLTWKDRLVVTGGLQVATYPSFEDSGASFYPSARLTHRLSELQFWSGTGLDRLFPRFTLQSALGFSGGPASVLPFYRAVPEGVTPERQREVEIGADAHLFTDRVAVEATYYRQRTSDLLVGTGSELDPTFSGSSTGFGFQSLLKNAGTLTNRGIELSVQAQVVDQARTDWTTTINFSRNRNEVSGLPEDNLRFSNSFERLWAVNGEPLGVFYGFQFDRDASGNVVDREGNILVKDDDGLWRLRDDSVSEIGQSGLLGIGERGVVGDPHPDFVASWINDVSIRNFDLRMQWDAVVGHDVFNFTRYEGSWPILGVTELYQQELEGDLPSGYASAARLVHEHWVEDGSFLKLREVSAAYTLRPAAARIERVRLTLAARNVLSIDGYSGYDPEINVGGQRTGVRGLDFAEVPIPRTFSLGVTAVF